MAHQGSPCGLSHGRRSPLGLHPPSILGLQDPGVLLAGGRMEISPLVFIYFRLNCSNIILGSSQSPWPPQTQAGAAGSGWKPLPGSCTEGGLVVVAPTAEWGSSDQGLTPLGAEHRAWTAPLLFLGPQTVLKKRHNAWGWRWLTQDPVAGHKLA